MDFSELNGLLAWGGTEGNIIIIDWAALKVVNSTNNHSSEILQIYFYDDQHQLISIAKNGVIPYSTLLNPLWVWQNFGIWNFHLKFLFRIIMY